ncbi:MAG: response regulator transcription factor [Nitrospinota bacterium]|nr:response regulator transcription factor [Nitrospinota bacterium]
MNEKKKVRVILAEDEFHIRELMKRVFLSMNTEVVAEAGNGSEAVNLYRQHKPDILLLDINMPQVDGRAALKQVMKEFPKAFVVMLTAVSSMNVVQECLDAGASCYIRKDTSLDEIKASIKESWGFYQKSIKGK